ncbi:hypothetical protein [Asanoa siamensis]|uniref:hypothetical protein n=1 Tax=Asanoa siamensis TaxID=926357 RepID=UPI001941FC21|nr:hypothetical protein [Asanoa siamensis]
MGYSGYVVIARTGDTGLDELACIEDLFVSVTENVRAGGWRIGFLGPVDDTSLDGLAKDLALETSAPAIALSVLDSDCAFATAADPTGGAVEFYLNEEVLLTLVDDDIFEPLNAKALPGLLAWAGRAGLTANRARLAAAIEESPGPFGDGIVALADALGIEDLPD